MCETFLIKTMQAGQKVVGSFKFNWKCLILECKLQFAI